MRGVIQINEVDAIANPVEVCVRLGRFGIVFKPLFFEVVAIQVIVKLLYELGAVFRRRGFVIADANVEGRVPPGLDLVSFLDTVVL